VYIDEDQLRFSEKKVRLALVDELNRINPQRCFRDLHVEWCLEDSEDFKLSKGVFTPPGTENSFIMARVVNSDCAESPVPIPERISDIFKEDSLCYGHVRFYFQDCGVGTLSVRIDLEDRKGISILELEQISESINNQFKMYFEELCYDLTIAYRKAVEDINVPRHQFGMLPNIEEVDRSQHFIPWTHRIYHIPDDRMFELENPGEQFRALLTPSRKMDIEDLSIYDNRWVYFGWGHSIIFTHSKEDGYSQTSRPVYDYVRLVEIAQANWQFLDILKDIVTYAISSFNRHYQVMGFEELQEAIDEIRLFSNGIDRILSYYSGVKITFDTEKRILLKELHDRWLTESMLENLHADLERIEVLLDQLHERQKETREESLNTIALLFTIVGIVEVIALVFDVLSPIITFHPFVQLLLIATATLLIAFVITMYLRLAGRN
jgi:hypothetical protein